MYIQYMLCMVCIYCMCMYSSIHVWYVLYVWNEIILSTENRTTPLQALSVCTACMCVYTGAPTISFSTNIFQVVHVFINCRPWWKLIALHL